MLVMVDDKEEIEEGNRMVKTIKFERVLQAEERVLYKV